MFRFLLLAGAGGFFGTCCRYIVNKLCESYAAGPFPVATFIVNLTGCFLFGLILGLLDKNRTLSPELYALLITGFCGGLTTFSTFSNELFRFSTLGEWLLFSVYLISSILLGLILVWFGKIIIG